MQVSVPNSQAKVGLLNRPDILRWQPGKWEEIAGNRALIRRYQQLLRKTRNLMEQGGPGDKNKPSFLVTGPSRSGKTAATKFLVRCIGCQQLDPKTLNPCDGGCEFCKQQPELGGLEGLFAEHVFWQASVPVHFTTVDCTKIASADDMRKRLTALGAVYNGIRLFYFDEVHRLQQRGMEEMLLKTVEEISALWFFSTAKPGGLEEMFTNRLIKISTELPSVEEMAHWLVDRCQSWGIPYEDAAVLRVIEKSNCVCGTALHALALAALDDDTGLTVDLVENEWNLHVH